MKEETLGRGPRLNRAEKNQSTKHKQSEQPVAASYRRKRRLQTLKHTASYSFQQIHMSQHAQRIKTRPSSSSNKHQTGSTRRVATDDAVVQRRKLKIAASNPSFRDRVHHLTTKAIQSKGTSQAHLLRRSTQLTSLKAGSQT